MGLPMFREPTEADAHNVAARLDRAASIRRSTIRREPTVRPNRSPRAQSSSVQALRERSDRVLRRSRLLLERDQRQIEYFEAELQRLRQNAARSRARLESENAISLNEAQLRIVNENETSQIGDALVDTEAPRMRSVRLDVASNLSDRGSASPRRFRSSRRPYMPSPPYSQENDRAGGISPNGMPRLIVDGPATLTPNFAPARGPLSEAVRPIEGMTRVVVEHGPSPDDAISALETPPPEDWESSYPPLRRVRHLSPRPSRPTYDGLGDRRRSLSPHLSDSHEEDAWETLLTTIDDDQRPSASTSFASTARSGSATRSNRSSQTITTSFGEIGQLDESCDLDLPPGINEEDARRIRARHEESERSLPMGNYEFGRISRTVDSLGRASSELAMFQNILSRMQRREDVPAEWWAAVGLEPVVLDYAARS